MFRVFLCIARDHDWWLVLVAALVCVASTFATFFLYSKVPAFPLWRRWAWLGMAGVVAGSGIWTTHFVAMLAFKTGLETEYDIQLTLGSLVVAALSTTLGFAVASRRDDRFQRTRPVVGGLVVGLGITAMHYVGMAGYRTTGLIQWDRTYVLASILVGALFASAALAVAGSGIALRRQAMGAGVLTLGIVGMHFTGMTAVTILPVGGIVVPASLMSDAVMAVAAVAVTSLIILIAIGGVLFDSASRNGHLKRLRQALDVLPEGLAFFDASDRLVAWNTGYAELCSISETPLTIGLTFAEMMQASLALGNFPSAAGREREWLAERLAARRAGSRTLTQKNAAGRWIRITDRRTEDGGIVTVGVDITDLKNAEEAMAAARDKAEELARRAEAAEAVAGLGHWRLDAVTREITWSDQMYRIYGVKPGDSLELDALMDMTHPDDKAVAIARIERQMVEGGADENSITRVISATGEIRYLVGNSDAQRGPNGEIESVIGTATDVTAQKLAEIAIQASEERFRRLAVNAPDMITESQLDGTMTYVSPASLTITGFTPEELIGRSFMSLMEPEDGEKVLAMCQTVFRSKGKIAPWPVEFRAKHKEGRELWLECKPTLATDLITGRFTCLNDVVRDITPRKVLEAQLRLAQADAEAAANVKADFLANMSHELRTPLTSIIGFTRLAAEQTDLADLTRDYIDRVGNASRALLCTVNDILDFSKLEAGQVTIHPAPVTLAKLSRATLDLFTPQAGAKDLTLTLDEDCGEELVVSIDPDRIQQILLNLVSNAVKFTITGGVTLRTRYDRSAARLRIEVIDTGAGLTAEQQDRLFKRFSQIDGSLTRTQSGTGLGLAICKGLVEAMGGEIGVESRGGEGSRFWFEVPAAPAAWVEVKSAAQISEEISFTGVRVLVADDNPANRELARLFLSGVGVEVSEAVDGEEAARMAMELPYDVILMDVQMPVLNGPGALLRIREARGPNDVTPVLAFTADATPETRAQLLGLGFDAVVEKPVNPQTLITAVAHATAFAQQLQETRDAA